MKRSSAAHTALVKEILAIGTSGSPRPCGTVGEAGFERLLGRCG